MSPEQAAGIADVRTDVYGVGRSGRTFSRAGGRRSAVAACSKSVRPCWKSRHHCGNCVRRSRSTWRPSSSAVCVATPRHVSPILGSWTRLWQPGDSATAWSSEEAAAWWRGAGSATATDHSSEGTSHWSPRLDSRRQRSGGACGFVVGRRHTSGREIRPTSPPLRRPMLPPVRGAVRMSRASEVCRSGVCIRG